jgi:hypothetical protein
VDRELGPSVAQALLAMSVKWGSWTDALVIAP